MNPESLHMITVLGSLAILAYYETHRQFKQAKVKGMEAILREWPRVLFTIAIVPGAGKVVLDVIEKLAN